MYISFFVNGNKRKRWIITNIHAHTHTHRFVNKSISHGTIVSNTLEFWGLVLLCFVASWWFLVGMESHFYWSVFCIVWRWCHGNSSRKNVYWAWSRWKELPRWPPNDKIWPVQLAHVSRYTDVFHQTVAVAGWTGVRPLASLLLVASSTNCDRTAKLVEVYIKYSLCGCYLNIIISIDVTSNQ